MTVFEFDFNEVELSGAEHIVNVNREIVAAFVNRCKNDGITKAKIAERMGVDRSVVTRMLRGNSNLTLRTIGELCAALDMKPNFKITEYPEVPNGGDVLARENAYSSSIHNPITAFTSSAPSRFQEFGNFRNVAKA